MDVTNFLVAFLAISPVLDTVDGGVSSPPDMEVCEGENFTIPWSYDDLDSDISNVVWKVNTTNIMTYFGGGGNRTPEGGYNVISANNEGSITVTSAERSNTGTYRIDISALTSSSDEVDALVCKSASSTVDSTKTGSVIQCTASDLGEPEAQLYIKVNGNAQSSSSATVKNTDRVECCISGCAVKCIDGNNEYCKNIQGCECECKCEIQIILCIIFCCLGMICTTIIMVKGLGVQQNVLLIIVGSTTLLYVVAIALGIAVLVDEDCKECCCDSWVKNSSIAFVVLSGIGIVVHIVMFCLVFNHIIGPDANDEGGNVVGTGSGKAKSDNSNSQPARSKFSSDRAKSDGEVSRKDVTVQENEEKLYRRPMPPIPPKSEHQDNKGRDSSANNDHHQMIIPEKKAGQLMPLEEEPKKKKKKKKKADEIDF